MDKNYDDGLVHCHNWACGPETTAETQVVAETAATAASARPEEHLFDDGLVHSHDWARG